MRSRKTAGRRRRPASSCTWRSRRIRRRSSGCSPLDGVRYSPAVASSRLRALSYLGYRALVAQPLKRLGQEGTGLERFLDNYAAEGLPPPPPPPSPRPRAAAAGGPRGGRGRERLHLVRAVRVGLRSGERGPLPAGAGAPRRLPPLRQEQRASAPCARG